MSATAPYVPPYDDDIIDLRAYVLVLVRRWRLIAAMVIVAMVAALGYSLLRPAVYESEVAVVITTSMAELSLEPRFRTTFEGLAGDAASRRNALQSLVRNPTIAARVLEELRDDLPAELQSISALMKLVDAKADGDLVRIMVRHGDPAISAMVANAWGVEYERHVNRLYGGIAESWDPIKAQEGVARAEYEAAEAALVAFTRESRLDELTPRLAYAQNQLGAHQEERLRLELLLQDARSLLSQVQAGGQAGAESNAMAIALLKTQVYASSGDSLRAAQLSRPHDGKTSQPTYIVLGGESRYQLSPLPTGDADARAQEADLTALVSVLQARLDEVDALIGVGEAEGALHAEIRALQGDLEAERARRDLLKHERDLAWETYTTVSRKVAELSVGAAVTGSVIRLASEAPVPAQPMSSGALRNAALAAAVALMLGVGLVLFLNMLEPTERVIAGEHAPSTAGE